MPDVLFVIPVRNEPDIAGWTTRRLLAEGMRVKVLDDWSDDGTYEILGAIKGVDIVRFPPDRPTREWSLVGQLVEIEEIGLKNPGTWIVPAAADEIFCSPWPGVGLAEAFSRVEAEGYNFIDTAFFNFVPTKDGFCRGMDPEKFFTHGEMGSDPSYRRIYLSPPGVRAQIAANACHDVMIPGRRIYPVQFVVKHYPLRSNEQGRKKIDDRRSRFAEEEKKKGWHTHYNNVDEGSSYIGDETKLTRFGDIYPGV
jgi:hypothetical protein